ncbi:MULTISPECIES: TIR-like protein FxsC [unclassified Streptomyces]|uniref:TIR-like protein FxsC n=1 Tax=unclassified Streptomyces TaxID=2593676 RepID=UPI002E81EFD2|nr:TIR-like protein FxsC [Streptomyces sp. NBC_00589]WTI41514.1 TIR-like protein FxsC [Streptomyces sp. NBC_00775]WUB24802.1 TIR-like protein FxsC [Streptomyces sp. NBC_00589]
MPDQGHPDQDGIARSVAALSGLMPGLDGTALADLLWLASRMDGDKEDESAARSSPQSAGAPPAADAATRDVAPPPTSTERALHERLGGANSRVRGDPVATARASGLPSPLEVTRALRPWKRRWRQGRRPALDIDATVDDYARSGELLPVFTPAPERWFDLVLVVDRSLAMQVWRESVADFTAVLDRLGAFRTLQVRSLGFAADGRPELRDGQGRLMSPGQLKSPDARRLLVTVSDCASPGWHEAAVWRQLYQWAASTPVALLNPLPTKLWRRTGLDLPTVRVSNGVPGSVNSRLDFDRPPLLPREGDDEKEGDWLPIPVLSMSPHALDRWSRTLMRTDPEGCGAVLVPRKGRPEGSARRPQGSVTAERFLRTASPPAARLAVLCSTFDRLSMRLLHLIRQELVPESTVADVAELLTSGLFSLDADELGTVELSLPETARRRLRQDLAEHDVWRIHRGLSRRMAARENRSGQLLAVAHDPDGGVGLPAELQEFGSASLRTLELLGLSAEGGAGSGRRRQEPAKSRLVAATESTPDRRPYFFLSYAHTPAWGPGGGDPDHWVHVLFTDLCDHIMALTDLPAGTPAGFMDQELRSGEGWPEKLSENLASCRVFVPLLSPRYFTSESCGREWFAFNERVLQARTAGAGSVSAFVPALWTHVEVAQLPDSVRHIHVDQAAFGARYAANGIYGLIKLKRLRDEYEEVVLGLAQRIVQVARESPLPPGQPRDYARTPVAFRPRSEGPRYIRLTVVAPTRHSIPEHRDPRSYGEDAEDWNPYHAASTRPLASLAEDLIRSLDYRVTVSSFDDDEIADETLDEAGRVPTPEILLIDRWALTDEERRRRLAAFDASARPWVSAIVPWNRSDMQCHGEEGRKLAADLERTLPSILDRGRRTDCQLAVNGVPTLKAFTDILPAVVAHVTRQYLKQLGVTPPSMPRPRLRGPAPQSYPEAGPDGEEET